MPSKPDNKFEERLEAYAQQRRQAAGPPLELHPATRQLLQAEVVRTYGSKTQASEGRTRWLLGFWPRLAWGSALFATLAITGLVLIRPLEKPAEKKLASQIPPVARAINQPVPEPAQSLGAVQEQERVPLPAPAPRISRGIDSKTVAQSAAAAPARSLTVARARTETEEAAKGGRAGIDLAARDDSKTMLAAKDAAQVALNELAANGPVGAAPAPLAPSAATPVSAVTASDTEQLGRLAAAEKKQAFEGPTVLADKQKSALVSNRFSGPAKATDADNLVLGGATGANVNLAYAPSSPATLSSSPSTPGSLLAQYSYGRPTQATYYARGFAAPSATSTNAVMRWRFSQLQNPAATSLDRRVSRQAARPAGEPRSGAGSRAAGAGAVPIMSSFELQQNGSQITILEKDGSQYIGQIISPEPERAPNVELRSTALAEKSPAPPVTKPLGQLVSRAFADKTNTIIGSFRFQATGSNVSLNQKIMVQGRLTPATNRSASIDRVQMTATSNGTATINAPAINQQETQLPPIRLRLEGQVFIGETNQYRLNALGVPP